MTERAATHQGHCQACGSVQMLPKGVLAKHGYTTEWGVFNGTCAGSGYRPFEQATDFIAKVIESQRLAALSYRNHAAEVRASTNTETMTVRVYVRPEYRRQRESGYQWVEAKIEAVPFEAVPNITTPYWKVTAKATVNGREQTFVVERHTSDVDRTLRHLRENWALHLDAQADGREKYVEWQKARLTNWQEQPLIPRNREQGQAVGE